MTTPIGTAGRDGDDLLIRLTAGPRRGRFRVPAAEVDALLAGGSAVVRDEEGAAVGDIATSRSLRVLIGAFRSGRGFVVQPAAFPVAAPAFLVPRAHLAAHYDRHDGPVPVLGGRRLMLFLCHGCVEQCDLRVRESDDPSPPTRCPFERVADPRWREAPSGRETTVPGAALVPGPFCEIPAHAIARATASRGRYTIELAGADRLELPVSRAAFAEAVRAMEAVDGLR